MFDDAVNDGGCIDDRVLKHKFNGVVKEQISFAYYDCRGELYVGALFCRATDDSSLTDAKRSCVILREER